jgi:CMP/dCMP kinase
MKRISTIAIDGPVASGKSTVGQRLAHHLGYLYFDTGVMYRGITWLALQRGVSIQDEAEVTGLAEKVVISVARPSVDDGRQYDVYADGVDITWDLRKAEVDANVSPVSAYPGVRRALGAQQRAIGLRGDVVMVGRDIGTVILPDADLKVYLEASAEERARRRYLDQVRWGQPADYEAVLAATRRRDEIDSTRTTAPLKAADDAVILPTDRLDVDGVVDAVLRLIAEREKA